MLLDEGELCCLVILPRRVGMKNSGGCSGLHGGIAEFNVFCLFITLRLCGGDEYWIDPDLAGIGGGGPRVVDADNDWVLLTASLNCGGLIFGGSVGGGEEQTTDDCLRAGIAGFGRSILSDFPTSPSLVVDWVEVVVTVVVVGTDVFLTFSDFIEDSVSWTWTCACVFAASFRIFFWCCIKIGFRLSLPAAT